MLLYSSANYLKSFFSQRKHEALEVDEEDSIIAENEVLWRANFERFIFCLKKKVSTRFFLEHAYVLIALLYIAYLCRCMY